MNTFKNTRKIHEHREEQQKGKQNFASLLDGCFPVRFMNTVKNTRKIHEHREEHQKDVENIGDADVP
ncbi:hypothetical protein DEO72_LG6g1071 [Vigna unguiculata]|uniref:Uncharacterized protein n=1 Tax=Vigna unguiculata TaxID=3917 RepID=A0A4D6M4U1_VIGUN|nr:hypothetical protein DEO72_LG6g1071 [Vigna unguiculata]